VRFTKKGILLALSLLSIVIIVRVAGREETKYEFNVSDTSEIEINSNRHTQAETEGQKVKSIVSLDEFEKKLENDKLEIWFHEKLASIRIVDKRSGYLWGFVGVEKPSNLNKAWYAMANSLCTIEYYDNKGADSKISLSSGDIEKEYIWKENSLECRMNAKKIGIRLTFKITLEDNLLTFSTVEKSLVESGDSKIKSIYYAPFLGATQETEIDGYMLVPDGPGALIRYTTAMEYTSNFSKKVYGTDMGIDTLELPSGMMASRSDDYLVEEPQISMPIYGIVHGVNQNGVLAVLKNGVEYATITANVSGITTNYNWIAARFDYRQSYMHPTTKSGTGIYMPQENINLIQPEISYYFLTGEEANYSGMAIYYRNLLEEEGILSSERIDATIPLRIDVLGADVKKGFLYNPLKIFTTTNEAERMVTELSEIGITNLTLTYLGWQKGGINGAKFSELGFEANVGKEKNYIALKEKIEAQNGRLYLYLDPVSANTKQISKVRQAVVTLSKTYALTKRADKQLMFPETYFIKPSVTQKLIQDSSEKLGSIPLAFDNIGYRLYADYTRNKWITRQETRYLIIEQIKASEYAPALYQPNLYLWKYTGEYYDIPMVNSQYLFETDTVPFMQIVLKGNVDYYAPYSNQGYYSANSILKMIEYGTYPSFIVAAAENFELIDTPQVDLFTVNFNDWKGSIQNIYFQINESLSRVEGSKILEHKVLMPGIVSVKYDNGITIFVNYTSTDYSVEAATVPALGFAVIER